MTIPLKNVKARLMKNPKFREAYDALDEEYSLASKLVAARTAANLTQEEVAERMGTRQPTIARMESGGSLPSVRTLRRYAGAVGLELKIDFARPRPLQKTKMTAKRRPALAKKA